MHESQYDGRWARLGDALTGRSLRGQSQQGESSLIGVR